VAFQYDGYPMVGKLFASGLITQDGETQEGQVMQRIIVLGKVTATIFDDDEPERPTISVRESTYKKEGCCDGIAAP